MMKRFFVRLITVLCVVCTSRLSAETPEFLWGWSAGEVSRTDGQNGGRDVEIAANGNCFFAGQRASRPGFNGGIFIAEISKNGEEQWTLETGGNVYDAAYGVDKDANSNIWFTGFFNGSATFGGNTISASGKDIFLARYRYDVFSDDEPEAGFYFAQHYGPGADEGWDVACGSNCVYATGFFQGTWYYSGTSVTSTASSADAYVMKLDENENIAWIVNYGDGGTDIGAGCAVDLNDNVFVVGINYNDSDIDDIFINKYNSSGVQQWSVCPNSSGNDAAYGVETNGNDIYFTGYFTNSVTLGSTTLTSAGGRDVFIAKMNSTGGFVWAISEGGSSDDVGWDLKIDNNSNLLVTGEFTPTAYFGTPSDQVELAAGENKELFVACYNLDGDLLWVKQSNGGTWTESGKGIAIDPTTNRIVVAGQHNGTNLDNVTLVEQTTNCNLLTKLGIRTETLQVTTKDTDYEYLKTGADANDREVVMNFSSLSSSSNITVRQIYGEPQNSSTDSHCPYYYDISSAQAVTFSADITFHYCDDDVSESGESNLNVYYYDDENSTWVLENTNRVPDLVNNTLTVTITHFSDFGLFEESPISVDIVGFQAFVEGNQVNLEWQTENEINIAGYNVLRKEVDHNCFRQINKNLIVADLDGHNNGDYFYSDVVKEGLYEYKIEILELDGSSYSSHSIQVHIFNTLVNKLYPECFVLFSAYPNPFNASTTLSYHLARETHVQVRIFDIKGRLVRLLLNAKQHSGDHKIIWDSLDDLQRSVPSGLYFVECQTELNSFRQKLSLVR